MAVAAGGPYDQQVNPPWPARAGHATLDQTPTWALSVVAAAIACATDTTTVTYAQVRTQAMWLTLADLQLRCAVADLLAAALHDDARGTGR